MTIDNTALIEAAKEAGVYVEIAGIPYYTCNSKFEPEVGGEFVNHIEEYEVADGNR